MMYSKADQPSLEIKLKQMIDDRSQLDKDLTHPVFTIDVPKIDPISSMINVLQYKDDIESFMNLFKENPYYCNNNITPLNVAIDYGNLEVIQNVLKFYDYTIPQTDDKLFDYVFKGNKCSLVFEEIMKIKNIKINNEHLITCSRNGDINNNIFRFICDNTDINHCDLLGNTALFYCSTKHFNDKIKILLEYPNINLHCVNKFGENILVSMINNRDFAGLSIILDHFNDDKYKDDIRTMFESPTDETHEIIYELINNENSRFIELMNMLDKYGCNYNMFNGILKNPLIATIDKFNKELFDVLINNSKINVNIIDSNNTTPLKSALVNCLSKDISEVERENKLYYFIKLIEHVNIDINMVSLCDSNILFYLLENYYSINKAPLQFDVDGFKENTFFSIYDNSIFSDKAFGSGFNSYSVNLSQKREKICKLLIKYIIDAKLNPDVLDNTGKTVLEHLVDNNDMALFKLLLSCPQLNVNTRNRQGQTLFMYILNKLKNNNKPDNKSDTDTTPQIFRSDFGSGFTIKPNLAKFNSLDLRSDSELHIEPSISCTSQHKNGSMSRKEYIPYLNVLLQHAGFNPNIQDIYGNTILFYCVYNQDETLLQLLLNLQSKNININMQNYCGNTVLMNAVEKNLWYIVELLVNSGANSDIKNNAGKTIFDYVTKDEHKYVLSNITKQQINNNDKQIIDNIISPTSTTNKSWFF